MRLKYRQKLFIFDPKEMIVLVFLFIATTIFTFTLGVHLAKQLRNPEKIDSKEKIKPVEATSDEIPSQIELTEHAQEINESSHESLQKSLHDEVEKMGIKLKSGRQVHLPKNTKSPEGGATQFREAGESKPEAK